VPRWWVVLWFAWGLLVAALVLLLDEHPWLAVPWALTGTLLALLGWKAFYRLSLQVFEWNSTRKRNADLRRRIFLLIAERKTDAEEFKQLTAEDMFQRHLLLAPLVGLVHGLLLGPVAGALFGLDDTASISASLGAALGSVLGPMLIAFLVALTVAYCVELDNSLPFRERLARRALLILSPLLILSFAWRCLRRLFRRHAAH
jgi:hypothetical protein